jgi:hypothetical protein
MQFTAGDRYSLRVHLTLNTVIVALISTKAQVDIRELLINWVMRYRGVSSVYHSQTFKLKAPILIGTSMPIFTNLK